MVTRNETKWPARLGCIGCVDLQRLYNFTLISPDDMETISVWEINRTQMVVLKFSNLVIYLHSLKLSEQQNSHEINPSHLYVGVILTLCLKVELQGCVQ